jgi:ATP-dependent Clp protease ATP-binding subunit ClpC
VFNILLQIFEDGQLTDSRGRKVDFKNTLIIMTSNLGSDLIRLDSFLGFSGTTVDESSDRDYERMRDKVLDEVKRHFRPEFLNRIDSTVVFHSLNREQILEVVDLMLQELQAKVLEKGLVLQVTDAGREWIVDNGFDPKFGARPLRRLIQDKLEDQLSEDLLRGKFKAGDVVEVHIDEDGVVSITTPNAPSRKKEATAS